MLFKCAGQNARFEMIYAVLWDVNMMLALIAGDTVYTYKILFGLLNVNWSNMLLSMY